MVMARRPNGSCACCSARKPNARRLVSGALLMHDVSITPRRELSAHEWDALADSSDDAWLWHRHALQDAVATWPGRQDVGFAAIMGGKVVAIAPVHVVRSRSARLLR